VRLTEAQALLFGVAPDPRALKKKGQPKPKRKKSELPENILEEQIRAFLAVRGWTTTRQHVGSFVPTGVVMRLLASGHALTKESLFRSIVRVGAKGDLDWRADRSVPVKGFSGITQSFQYEAKAPGEKPRPEQRDRIRELQALGYIADYFDDLDDFPGPHSFVTFYRSHFGEP